MEINPCGSVNDHNKVILKSQGWNGPQVILNCSGQNNNLGNRTLSSYMIKLI